MKDRDRPGKKASKDQYHKKHNSRFPQLLQGDSLSDGRARPTLREHTRSPRPHVPTALTNTKPTLLPRPHITSSQSSTVTQGALLLVRNRGSHTELQAALVPQAPTMAASGGGLRCSTAAASGIMLGKTGKVCPRPGPRDLGYLNPLPPADKRPLESSAPSKELSRPKRPITGKKCPNYSFPVNITKPQKVVRAQELSTQAQNVPRAPVPPLQTTPAPRKLRKQLGRDQRRNRLTDFNYVSANTTECVCLTEDSLASVTALRSEYRATSWPQQPPPPPPQSPPSYSPSPPLVHYTPQPRLLTKRAQMEQKVLKTAVETSKQLPALSLGGSMVYNIDAEERRKVLRHAINKPRSKARDCEPPLVIMSVLREMRPQGVAIIRHGQRRNTAAAFRTRKFPMHTQPVHATILEHRVGLEALRKKAKDSGRTRGPVHRHRRRITLSLTMSCTFRLRTRKPIYAHRVVLKD